MRFLIAAVLVLGCSLCLAEDFPKNLAEIKSLTAEQAAELAAKYKGGWLSLNGLTSIDKDVAQELAKFKGGLLILGGLASIDKDVAQELAKAGSLSLGLTSIDKDVAKELVNTISLALPDLTSIDKDVAKALGKLKGKTLYISSEALQTYKEVNGESLSRQSGGMF